MRADRPRPELLERVRVALRLMETCYVVAERFSTADLQQVPSLWSDCRSLFPVHPQRSHLAGMREMMGKIAQLKAETMIVTDRSNAEAVKANDRAIVVPANMARKGGLRSCIRHPVVVPAQLFAASLAAPKGSDPDQPRTLQKVTRTLSGPFYVSTSLRSCLMRI